MSIHHWISLAAKPLTTDVHNICVSYNTTECDDVEKCFDINYTSPLPKEKRVTGVKGVKFVVTTEKDGDRYIYDIKLKSDDLLGAAERTWFKDGIQVSRPFAGPSLFIISKEKPTLTDTSICVVLETPYCSEAKQTK